jgi:hypothetical protein
MELNDEQEEQEIRYLWKKLNHLLRCEQEALFCPLSNWNVNRAGRGGDIALRRLEISISQIDT